jgi:carbon-monoxide dehydrogenase small subunit
MAVTHLVENEEVAESDEGLRAQLAGNLCRCTGYMGIVAATRQAAAEITSSRG